MRAATAAAILVVLLCVVGSGASAPRLQTDNPYWIAGGRLIAFSGGYSDDRDYWEAYVANADGSARRPVRGGVVSPSGRFTASMFSASDDEPCEVDIRKVDGTLVRSFRIPAGGCWNEPVWSPRERAVLAEVDVSRGFGDVGIYLVNVRSGPRLISRTSRDEEKPDWSPDGSRVVFVSCPRDTPFDCTIMIADRDGSRRQAIARQVEGGTGYERPNPVWSPDGDFVAYATPTGPEGFSRTSPPPRRWGIYVVRIDGTARRLLATTPYLIGEPSVVWSARSRSVAFSDTRGIWTVRLDGSHLHRHTTRSDDYSSLSWAPAHSILFVRDEAIYRVRPGGKVRRLLP